MWGGVFGSMGGGSTVWWLLQRGLGFRFVVIFWLDLGSVVVVGWLLCC